MNRLALATVLLALGVRAFADDPLVIKTGNPLRKTLLDALRPTIEKDLSQKIKFEVWTLRANKEWAFFGGQALQFKSGKPVDLKTTRYKDIEPMDGPSVFALLRKKNNKWQMVTFIIGPTDVAWAGWDSEFGVPRAVLGKNPKVPG